MGDSLKSEAILNSWKTVQTFLTGKNLHPYVFDSFELKTVLHWMRKKQFQLNNIKSELLRVPTQGSETLSNDGCMLLYIILFCKMFI